MFANVIVGIDGRPTGRDAIAFARRLARPSATLTLVHVRSGSSDERSTELLERELRETGIKARTVSVLDQSPGAGLHREAERRDADLLVVGSCARGALGRAALGDDTRAALNGAPCAVAIAAKGYAVRDRPIANVGVAYDGSPESIHALLTARVLAANSGATIHALKVVSLPSLAYTGYASEGLGETIDALLEQAQDELAELPDVHGRAAYGLVGEELAAFGDEVDILVAGSRGYGPLHRLVVGSTCRYLERHARCSLLVLPRTAAVVHDLGVAVEPAAAEPEVGVAAGWARVKGDPR